MMFTGKRVDKPVFTTVRAGDLLPGSVYSHSSDGWEPYYYPRGADNFKVSERFTEGSVMWGISLEDGTIRWTGKNSMVYVIKGTWELKIDTTV